MAPNGLRATAVAAAVAMAVLACACDGSGAAATLATDQTLTFPMQDDVETLDPAHVSSAVDIAFAQEVFSGLYRFDNNLKVVNDIATGMPDVSSDGKTYTFRLRRDARFSNGDPIRASDFLYSWNRAARLNDAYATVFAPVVGFEAASAGSTQTMSGLTTPDDYTIKAQLSDPAGFWLTELALWIAAVVDQRVIQSTGEDLWWNRPETLLGAGPFKMTARTPKASMEFAPVPGWWGGSTGSLKRVRAQIGIDQSSAIKKFEAGGYDVVGLANNPPSPDDILRYRSDPARNRLLNVYPSARTTWLGFNFVRGPFAARTGGTSPGLPTGGLRNDPGKDGRDAFSRAIDRDQLVDLACVKGATCARATGGYIAKGLKGYLGDGADPAARFDPAAARAEYQKWDPDGSRVKGLKLRYNTSASNTQLFSNVQSQLRSNLNVAVELAPSDFSTLVKDRKAKAAVLFRNSWGADYDHPQDWFNNLWTCDQASSGKGNAEGYCNPAVDRIVQEANSRQIDQAVAEYREAQKLMVQDTYAAALQYGTQSYLVQGYVQGAGFNSLYDHSWRGIRILKH